MVKRFFLSSALLIAVGTVVVFRQWAEPADPVAELMSAAEQPDTARLQALLRGEGAPPINTQDWQGRTALFHAARHGQPENLRLLLEAGADVNLADRGGLTPLYAAAWFGYTDCVRQLLQIPGIAAGVETDFGETAYTAAKLNQHHACVQLLSKLRREAALAELSKRHLTHPNTQRLMAETALLQDDAETLQLLLDAEVITPLEADAEGKTLLDRAVEQGCEQCTELLLNHESDR